MALGILPLFPLPAETTVTPDWNESATFYDSGVYQGATNFAKPLNLYQIPIRLMTDVKQSSLWNFFRNVVKGQVTPFLFKAPDDFAINSGIGVRSGIVSGTSLYIYDANSYMVRADTTTIGSLFSSLSGYVRLGVEYNYSQDQGIITVNTKASGDTWGVRSMQYFRKVVLTNPYVQKQIMYGLYSVDQLPLKELP